MIPTQLAAVLFPLGEAALSYALKEGQPYLAKIFNGQKLTVEEKDDFFAIVDKAFRMEKEGHL